MQNVKLDESQSGIKIAGRNINSLIYADDTALMAENEEELESFDKGERGEQQSSFETQYSRNKDQRIWSHHFTANRNGKSRSGDIFLSLGSKISADGDCSHKIKRHLLLRRKAMTDLDSILKSRDITLLTKVHIIKAMVFPVVMYGCESWTIKKAEHQKIDAFDLWCWRRLLRVPQTEGRSNQ